MGRDSRLRHGRVTPVSRPTLADVARGAGVAVSVASRVLSGDATLQVKASTRTRVLRTAQALEYVPQHAGRALRTSRTDTLALCIPGVTNPLFEEIRSGVESVLDDAGYSLVFADADKLSRGSLAFSRLIGSRRVDGMILQRSSALSDEEFEAVIASGMPTVLINSTADNVEVSSIVLPDREAMRIAVEHLAGLGHHEVGLLGGPERLDWAERRSAGFLAAVRSCGVETRPEWQLSGGYTVQSGAEGMRQLVGLRARPTAIVVENVLAGVGAMSAARRLDVQIPADLSVVAIHDLWLAECMAPALTTVRLPLAELGATSARLLLAQFRQGAKPEQTCVASPPPHLIVRESTMRRQTR